MKVSGQVSKRVDVAVIGGGPAGISSCIELSNDPDLNVALFEIDTELGGIPRLNSHSLFGFRDLKRVYRGPAYAKKLEHLLRKTSTNIHTGSTVLNIIPDVHDGPHHLEVLSERGVEFFEAAAIVLATGCFENSRAARIIPGTRPAGVFTSGTVMEIMKRYHSGPGKRAVILGSEHVALSCALALKRMGTSIVAMIEEDNEIQTYSRIAKSLSLCLGFPIYKGVSINTIYGRKRVSGLELKQKGKTDLLDISCDTVVLTGKFRPYTPLIDQTDMELNGSTLGPTVDGDLGTSVPNIFAAGNVIRGADMHDLCALEGRQAARSILKKMGSRRDEYITISAEDPIRYVAPQRIRSKMANSIRSSWCYPGFSIQTAHTLKAPTLEAWSGKEKIWQKSFSKLIANTRVPLPINQFDWHRVDHQNGITLKIYPKGNFPIKIK